MERSSAWRSGRTRRRAATTSWSPPSSRGSTRPISPSARAATRLHLALRRTSRGRRLADLGAEVVGPDDAVARVRSAGGADVVLELVGSPNLAGDLEALATKGRIAIVGTGAGDEAPLSLRALMGRRGRILGTVLR